MIDTIQSLIATFGVIAIVCLLGWLLYILFAPVFDWLFNFEEDKHE